MRVILLKDVQKIGKRYDIKNVADGFALNSLIPQGKAKVATDAEVKKIEALKKVLEAEMKIQEDLLLKNLHELDGKEVVVKEKANSKGHLFAQLHKEEIVMAVKNATGVDIVAGFIQLDKPIKETGLHTIEIKAGSKKALLRLVVEEAK